jgi:hypothetical protein
MVGLTIAIGNGLITSGGSVGATGRGGGGLEHEASKPRIETVSARRAWGFKSRREAYDMWVILLEAFGAMLILILIVWWTMFHGRKRGERDTDS